MKLLYVILSILLSAVQAIARDGVTAQIHSDVGQSNFHGLFDSETLMDLRKGLPEASPNGTQIILSGYYKPGDGGGGLFTFDSGSNEKDNGGTVIASGNGSGRWKREFHGSINVKWFGAHGDGTSDDSASISAAFSAASAKNEAAPSGGLGSLSSGVLYFPSGDYIFNHDGLVANYPLSIKIRGDGLASTRIRLGSSIYFLTTKNFVHSISLTGLAFNGGLGIWKHAFEKMNVGGYYEIANNSFSSYSEAAIASFASDMPYFKIVNNTFYGTTKSIAIALAGAADLSQISGNAFLLDRYHVKLANGGQNVKIVENDFIRFVQPKPDECLTDIWIVPYLRSANSGQGCEIKDNKFGNENLGPNDYRILVADEIRDQNFAKNVHAPVASQEYWVGAQIMNNAIATGSINTNGLIFSYTPNVYDYHIENIYWGGFPNGLVVFAPSVVASSHDRVQDLGVIKATGFVDGSESDIPKLTNRPGTAAVDDPFGFQQGTPDSIDHYPSGFDSSYTEISRNPVPFKDIQGNDTILHSELDALGDRNAATLSFSDSHSYAFYNIPSPALAEERRAWIEIDLRGAKEHSVKAVKLSVEAADGEIVFKRFISVNDGSYWQTIRFPWILHLLSSQLSLRVAPGDYLQGNRDQVMLGRLRIYFANEPQNPANIFREAKVACSPGLIRSQQIWSIRVNLRGATPGDFIVTSFVGCPEGVQLWGSVSSENIIAVYFKNESGTDKTVASGVLRVRVLKPTS